MKVCLINPPIEDFYSTSIRRQPLGLMYILASMKKAGYTPFFLNCHSPKKHKLPIPVEFHYLKKYINCSNPLLGFPFKDYYHFGLAFQEIFNNIKKINADIYFISSLFTTYFEEPSLIIKMIKDHNPNALIAAGGYHPSLYPEYFLKNLNCDYVLKGEGENSSIELLDCLKNRKSFNIIPGLFFKDGNNIIEGEPQKACDINSLPSPCRIFLKNRDLKFYGKRWVSIITSRGCPNSCDFCTARIIWGRRYRTRDIDGILREINDCLKEFSINGVNFEDDNIFAGRNRALELLNALIEFQETKKLSLDLTAMNGISIEHIDEEILELMKIAGMMEINISLMSRGADIQEKHKRPFDTRKFINIVNLAKKQGISVRSYFILGLPDQTKEEVIGTIELSKELSISLFPSIYYNVNSRPEEWKMQRSSAFFNETHHLSRDDLITFFNTCVNAMNN